MSVDFEKKFRSKGLDPIDEPEVRRSILQTNDEIKLLSYIDIYGRSFPEQAQILNLCDYYIKNPVPGLTANCMRVSIDFWNKYSEYYDVLESYLDFSLYEEWYDEIIFVVSFINTRDDIPFPAAVIEKFHLIISEPEIKSLEILTY